MRPLVTNGRVEGGERIAFSLAVLFCFVLFNSRHRVANSVLGALCATPLNLPSPPHSHQESICPLFGYINLVGNCYFFCVWHEFVSAPFDPIDITCLHVAGSSKTSLFAVESCVFSCFNTKLPPTLSNSPCTTLLLRALCTAPLANLPHFYIILFPKLNIHVAWWFPTRHAWPSCGHPCRRDVVSPDQNQPSMAPHRL